MRLSEALSLRKDLQKRIEQLRERAARNAVVQEGEVPTEDPNALVAEARGYVDARRRLVQRINLTNTASTLEDGTVLTVAIAERDALKMERAILTQVADAASPRAADDVYSRRYARRSLRSELRDVPQVDVAGLRRDVDDLARRIRELDQRIQAVNFTTDLIEQ